MMIRWSIWLDKKTSAVLKAMGETREHSVGWIIRKAVEDFIEPRKKDRSILDARVAPPTGIQNAVARRSACPCATTEHQP